MGSTTASVRLADATLLCQADDIDRRRGQADGGATVPVRNPAGEHLALAGTGAPD